MSENPFEIQNPDSSRRGFLKALIALFNGLIALALTVPGLGYLLTPVFRKGTGAWITLGSRDKFTNGEPQKATFKYISESGYTREQRTGFVWVVPHQTDADQVTVLSAVCTHTGCNVAWHSDEHLFLCPCHGGKYNERGEVVAGPPPRPLAKLPIRIENGEIAIQFSG